MAKSKLLHTEMFNDACELEDAINTLKYTAEAADGSEDEEMFPVIHVQDEHGNRFNRAQLYEQTLTDGSKVFHIELNIK